MTPEGRTPGRASPASWTTYRSSIGDRSALFAAIAQAYGSTRALYPGSYLDLAPSTAIATVTYVDTDRRAARFFADEARVRAELEGRTPPGFTPEVRFWHLDYTRQLPLPDADVDLLISLYAGPVWDHCHRYLAPRGLLLANTSHGDACLAALDPRLELVAAVHHREGRYRLDDSALDGYLRPTRPADADRIRAQGRGIRYTRSAFAYLFRLT